MSQPPLLKVKIVRTITILSAGRPVPYISLQPAGSPETALSSIRIYPLSHSAPSGVSMALRMIMQKTFATRPASATA